jgi:hypothetical protein
METARTFRAAGISSRADAQKISFGKFVDSVHGMAPPHEKVSVHEMADARVSKAALDGDRGIENPCDR